MTLGVLGAVIRLMFSAYALHVAHNQRSFYAATSQPKAKDPWDVWTLDRPWWFQVLGLLTDFLFMFVISHDTHLLSVLSVFFFLLFAGASVLVKCYFLAALPLLHALGIFVFNSTHVKPDACTLPL